MAEHLYIAQISDPHIKAGGKRSYRQVDTRSALEAAITKLNTLMPKPDLLLISGDLVDFGRPDEYATLKAILDQVEMPYYVIAGNHDDRQHLRDCFVEHDYLKQDTTYLHWVVEDYPVRLIGLDSTVPGAPYGFLCRERLAWLVRALDQQPAKPTVIMLHNHPFPSGIRHMDSQPLRNAADLEGILRGYSSIERVVCGHLHRNVQARFANTLACSCPGVSHQVDLQLDREVTPAFRMEPPGYLLHRWSAETGMQTHTGFIAHYPGPFPFYDENGLID
ncbi:phosphodiesterase [Litchfieldella xinjiangensis]|uniref:phosphodiesterase n=1 Tax=Litchfieldella xinjiangensis TaxID=1166948 RepID=UPI0005BAAC05|nr:phosphodiesterase [Halomonas xinjiangensis]